MKDFDLVIVGSDRTLGRTGEVANKIGTYTKAVLAKRHAIPFYVAIPLSTIDWELESGLDIPIEERDEDEVLRAWGITEGGRRQSVRVANPGSTAVPQSQPAQHTRLREVRSDCGPRGSRSQAKPTPPMAHLSLEPSTELRPSVLTSCAHEHWSPNDLSK